MGKFRIGARVRDWCDDEGVIVAKRKGERLVRYGFGEVWMGKDGLTAIPLKLEIGKTYVDRDGDAHGPLEKNTIGYYQESHPFAYGSLTWTPTGKFLPLDEGEDGWDLVAEVIDAPAPAAEPADEQPKFAVGQRVVVLDNVNRAGQAMTEFYTIGEVGTITSPAGFDGNGWVLDNKERFLWENQIKPFTLEAGKFYRTRDGRKVGPMVRWNDIVEHPWEQAGESCVFSDDGDIWRDNGTSAYGMPDIVAEWVEPEAEPVVAVEAAKEPETAVTKRFKIGDRVRIARVSRGIPDDQIGKEFTITAADGPSSEGWSGNCEESPYWWTEDDLELATPQPKFKVGDRVGDFDAEGEATIIEVIGDRFRVEWDEEGATGSWWTLDDWEFHTPKAAASSTPAIGDEVTVTGKLVAFDRDGDGEVHFDSLGYTLYFPTSALRAA